MPRNTDQPDTLDMRGALRDYILERLSGARVGVVQSYSQTDRVAVVQPVRRRKIFGTPQPVPVVRAAVGWWRFGTMALVGEVQAGDEVLLVTCEREIWPWYAGGQPLHDPTSERMHDASDSIALPWISNAKRAFTARQSQTFWLGREDGSAGVTFTMGPGPGTTTIEGTGPGSIALGSAAVNTLLMYPPFASAFAAWATAMANAGAAVASPGVPDPTGALYTAYAAAVTTATATLATAVAAAPTVATIKTVAE